MANTIKCTATDDLDKECTNTMSKKQHTQDGMCSRCADLIWSNFIQPINNNRPIKPIIFSE
jgi:hypothetical protein